MSIFKTSDDPLQVTLLVLPESSMMSLASVLDIMRATNRIAGWDLFKWNIATLSGKPARLTSDILIEPDIVLDMESRGDVFIVLASFNHQHHAGPAQPRPAGHRRPDCGSSRRRPGLREGLPPED